MAQTAQTAQLIDGKAIAAKVRKEVAEETARLKAEHGVTPGLVVIRVGEDPASKTYVEGKKRAAAEVGFAAREEHYDAAVTQEALLARIRELNADPSVHGVLIQLPIPKHLDPDALTRALDHRKDVDGFHPVNAGHLALGLPGPRPCTPWGVMRMLSEIGCDPAGKRAAVVGRSNLVGKPMSLMLLSADATVTLCHRKSDVRREVADADILVVAAGSPELVRGEWIKPGAVVIDVGMNRNAAGKLVGDVEFAAASQRASWITPVPGGVGPMTIAMLMRNTLDAAKRAVGVG